MKYLILIIVALAVVWVLQRKRGAPRAPRARKRTLPRRGKGPTSESTRKKSSFVSESGAGFVEITDNDFFGQSVRSQDGQFLVAWSDSDDENDSGQSGCREKGKGRVFLAHKDRVLWHQWLERPNEGCVSNNGTVAINDWLFGDKLAGVFCVFSPQGDSLISEPFQANLDTCGLIADGALAWCATCGSDHPDHDAKLFVFSVSPQQLLFSTAKVNSMWIESVSQSDDLIVVEDRDGNRTSFLMDGREVTGQDTTA